MDQKFWTNIYIRRKGLDQYFSSIGPNFKILLKKLPRPFKKKGIIFIKRYPFKKCTFSRKHLFLPHLNVR